MAKYIAIQRSGYQTLIRTELESASESPLTEHEMLINELLAERHKQLNVKREDFIAFAKFAKNYFKSPRKVEAAYDKWIEMQSCKKKI